MEIGSVNLRHVRAIVEIASTKRVSLAAERVHLSQSAVTQGLLKLENGLQAKLFYRGGIGMEPTPFGDVFIPRCERVLEQLRLGAREIQGPAGRAMRMGFGVLDHLITMTQARAIATAIDCESFALAARRLGRAQPAIHRAARDVEVLAGVKLFERTSHGIRPTRAGTLLSRRLKLAFVEVRQGIDEINRLKGVSSGRIVVGTLPLARTHLLPKTIVDTTNRFSELSVGIVDSPYELLLNMLREGEVDMIVGALRNPAPTTDIQQEVLLNESLSVIARSSHPLFRLPRPTIRDVLEYDWVVPIKGTPTREIYESLMKRWGQTMPTNLIETSSLIALRSILLESDRLTMLSRHQILYEEQSHTLSEVPLDLGNTSRPIGVTTRVDWEPTVVQSEFLDRLRANAFKISTDPPRGRTEP